MFRKKQKEFQYAPGIEKIIEDIQGGGTIARAELKGIVTASASAAAVILPVLTV